MADVGAIQDYARSEALKYNINPSVFLSMLNTESGFNPYAVSGAGAQGVGQLMPGTASSVGVSNPFDWRQNVEGSAKYFSQLLTHFNGDYPSAVAAYNAGQGRVNSVLAGNSNLPSETQNYLGKVFGNLSNFGGSVSDLINGTPGSGWDLFNKNNSTRFRGSIGGQAYTAVGDWKDAIANFFSLHTATRGTAIVVGILLIAAAVFVLVNGVKYVKAIGGTAVKAAALAA